MGNPATKDSPRQRAAHIFLLAVLYFVFGHASFLVLVDNVLVTPVLFAAEGIALAFVLRYGAGLWPGVFAGQLALALSRGLPLVPALGISAVNSLEAVLAVVLFRALKLDAGLPRARDLTGLLLVVFFVLQPFSASLGVEILRWGGVIVNPAELPGAWLNWWIGNTMGQMLVAPLLLAMFTGTRSRLQIAGDLIAPVAVLAPALVIGGTILQQSGIASFVLVLVPIFIVLAIYRGLIAVCTGGLFVAVCALYATSHGFGPFVRGKEASILDLNLFLVGLSLSAQFLSVFLRQAADQRRTEEELREAKERLQRTAYELTENIPVGTYVLEFDAAGNPRFTFLSERWLKMLGLRREDALADHALAVQTVHPDDRKEFERRNAEVFAQKKRFFWEGRIVVRGETRWVTIESIPRDRPGGGTIWEGAMIDITDRKRAEKQLQLVLDNLPIAVAATTLDSPAAMTFINEQFTRTFGYALEDVPTVAAWAEKAYPDPDYRREVFRDWDEAVFRAIKTRGSVESMEFEVACKDGTKRAIIFRAVVLDDRLLTSMTDVTDQKKAERALRALREKVERTAYELTENIPVGTYTMVQPPGGGMAYFSFMSTRFLELTGLDREAARDNPMNAFACVHPDDQEEWVRKNAYVFEHKLPFNEECRIFVKGETRWITAESKPRDLPDGSVVWEGVLTDITDRKLAEQKLAESEARLRKILDNIPVPLAINTPDRNGRITFLNKAFAETFGYSIDDIPTVDHWALLAYPDAGYRKNTFEFWDAAVEKAARTRGTIEPMEFRVCCKKGESRDVLINAVAMQDMLLVGFVDITARKRAEAHARELEAGHRRDLETKLRTSLEAAAVAHEINQPLSVILFQSKLALEDEEDAREAVARIADEAQRVVATIDKMKTLLRNVQTDHRRVDLASVVRSALLYNKGSLARHAIDVHTSGLGETCTIMGDDAQLQLALTNILRNSAEAIDESDAEKREISISLARRDGQAELCIGDSGPGWSGAEQQDMPLTTTKSGGTGIGLYVVRTTVQNHGGKIEFTRSPLGGAEVRLKFPLASISRASTQEQR